MSITIATYNIRLDTPDDGDWQWAARKEYVLANITDIDPQIFTVEEARPNQFADLQTLPGYESVGVGRDDGKNAGEYAAIFYKPQDFAKIDSGTKWISHTPDRPSLFPGAAAKRIYTWVTLRALNEPGISMFTVVTAHTDHISEAARVQAAKQLTADFGDTDHPVIMTGDYNMLPGSKPYALFVDQFADAYLTADEVHSPYAGTWQTAGNYRPSPTLQTSRLDYFFVNQDVHPLKYEEITTVSPAGRYASDHFPLVLTVDLK